MRRAARRLMACLSVAAITGLIGGMLTRPSGAQSELMNTVGFPYAAFDSMPHTDVQIPGAVIHVAFGPGTIALPQARVVAWIRQSAHAVSTYYGHFPVKSLRLLIVPVEGSSGIDGGTTWAYRGAATRIIYGADSSEDDLRQDWVLVHEMVHQALPDLDERYNWLSEGLAVYIEPVARVQAGDLQAREIWFAMRRDMPKGMPRSGDRGLDHTFTWGRTYWGGAMFCLLADIEIRKQTGNRLGLQDAMKGVLAKGNHEENWTIEEVLQTADEAVGLRVMRDLYDKMKARPVRPDMNVLWRDLGVDVQGNTVELDNTAPLAREREAVTRQHNS